MTVSEQAVYVDFSDAVQEADTEISPEESAPPLDEVKAEWLVEDQEEDVLVLEADPALDAKAGDELPEWLPEELLTSASIPEPDTAEVSAWIQEHVPPFKPESGDTGLASVDLEAVESEIALETDSFEAHSTGLPPAERLMMKLLAHPLRISRR